MNSKEWNRLMTRLPDSIPKLAVVGELYKLTKLKDQYPPASIEAAYVDAHFTALKNLVDKALEEK